MAADRVGWLRPHLPAGPPSPRIVVDGGYPERGSLEPAVRAGFVAVARLRKDAAWDDLPIVPPPGPKRRRGRPPISGKDRLSPAERAGQDRGGPAIAARTTTGPVVRKRVKTSLATGRPAGGVVRAVGVKEGDGSWRALLCTAPEASVAAVVPVALDRGGIERNSRDPKAVEGIERVQSRRVWSNVGALNLNPGVDTLIEVRAGGRSASTWSDRGDRPWDDAARRPWHADRRRAVQRARLGEGFQRISIPLPWRERIGPLLEGMVRMVA